MIAVYAMGGGLGHVARARRMVHALRALGFGDAPAAILSASPLARGPDIVAVPRRLARSRAEFGAWLKATLRALSPSAVVVDAFPLGILGELADPGVLPDTRLIHVARLLKWNAFRDAFPGTPRRYDATFTVEPLTPAHDAFLAANSGVVRSFDLSLDPESGAENSCAGLPRPVWLVVHSGPAAEVHRLLEFAAVRAGEERAAPQFVVVSPRALALPTGVTHLAHPRAWELFAPADRIVTACGFNSMLEASPWRGKHLYLPFERRFDDQHLRAQRATSLQC